MKQINLTKLVITVFIISWIGVLPSLLIAYQFEIPDALKRLDLLMTLGPILGATIFIYKAQGKQGLKQLFKRLLYVKAKPIVIIIALLSPIIYSYLAAKIGFAFLGNSWPPTFDAITILTNGVIIFLMYLIINTEEIVWRGVVFDKLLKTNSFIKSCLIIAPIWWLFHIPLFLYPEGHQAGYGIFEFSLIVIAQTFILGWIYAQSNRSLFYVHMHHQLVNGFGQAFPIFPVFIGGKLIPLWVFCILMLVLALVLVITKTMQRK